MYCLHRSNPPLKKGSTCWPWVAIREVRRWDLGGLIQVEVAHAVHFHCTTHYFGPWTEMGGLKALFRSIGFS